MGPPESSADRATRSRGASRSFRQSSSWHQAPRSLLGLTAPHSDQVEALKASAGADPEKHHPKSQHAPDLGSPKAPHLLGLPRRHDSSPTCASVPRLGTWFPAGVAVAAEAGSSPPAGCGDALVPHDRQGGRKGFEAESRRSTGAGPQSTAHGAVWPKASHPLGFSSAKRRLTRANEPYGPGRRPLEPSSSAQVRGLLWVGGSRRHGMCPAVVPRRFRNRRDRAPSRWSFAPVELSDADRLEESSGAARGSAA